MFSHRSLSFGFLLGSAQMALAEAGAQLIGGATGNVDEVVDAFLKGELEVIPDFQCRHHEHGEGHSCGDHLWLPYRMRYDFSAVLKRLFSKTDIS